MIVLSSGYAEQFAPLPFGSIVANCVQMKTKFNINRMLYAGKFDTRFVYIIVMIHESSSNNSRPDKNDARNIKLL